MSEVKHMIIPARILVVPALVIMLAGCQGTPNPPVPTLWQKLGIPQAFVTSRDAFRNRSGNFPFKEWKPPIKRLADPSNLADKIPGLDKPMPGAIKKAAEIKVQEDLAEQKIKGLKYLGLIGCDCYDDDGSIAAAFLEALKDCTPCVRLAAIEALYQTTDECDRRAQRFDRRRERCTRGRNGRGGLCGACRGLGCGLCACNCSACAANCGAGGCGDGVCATGTCGPGGCDSACASCGGAGCNMCGGLGFLPGHRLGSHAGGFSDGNGCSSCGGCGSCLTKEICQRLEDMAFKQDENGCWVEPVPEIRAAAERLLGRCPVFPEEVESEEENGVEEELPPQETGDDTNTTTRWNPGTSGYYALSDGGRSQVTTQLATSPMATNPMATNPMATNPMAANPMAVNSMAANPMAANSGQSLLIEGRVTALSGNDLLVTLDGSYLLPSTALILLRDERGTDYEYQIISADTGRILARPLSETPRSFANGAAVQIGVLAQ
jgi:hypothetical protein